MTVTTDRPMRKLQVDDMQRLAKGIWKEQKQRLAFYTGGKSDRVHDNEYDETSK